MRTKNRERKKIQLHACTHTGEMKRGGRTKAEKKLCLAGKYEKYEGVDWAREKGQGGEKGGEERRIEGWMEGGETRVYISFYDEK